MSIHLLLLFNIFSYGQPGTDDELFHLTGNRFIWEGPSVLFVTCAHHSIKCFAVSSTFNSKCERRLIFGHLDPYIIGAILFLCNATPPTFLDLEG